MEEKLAEHTHTGQSRHKGTVNGAGAGHGNLSHAAGHNIQTAAKEICNAAAEDGQGQAGDVLIGPQGDGQKAVEQSPQGRRQECRSE